MKRFLAFTLALLMIFGVLAGCGSDDKKDDKNNGNTTGGKSDGVLMGISIGNPGELVKLFTGTNPIEDIKDIYLEMAANENSEIICALGAKLFGDKYALKLFSGENVVISAPGLTNKNYGFTMEELMALMMGETAGPGVDSSVGSAATMAPTMMMDLLPVLAEYADDLLEELKTNAGLTVTENGGKTNIKGTITSDALAVVFTNLFLELCADDDFMAIMSGISGMTIEDMRKDLPEKDAMIAEFKSIFAAAQFSADVDLTLDNANDELKALDVAINLAADGIKFEVAFDVEKETFSFAASQGNKQLASITYADGKMDLIMEMDGSKIEMAFSASETNISGSVKVNGAEQVRLNVDIKDDGFDFLLSYKENRNTQEFRLTAKESGSDVTLTLYINAVETAKISFTKKVSGTKTTFTLKTVAAGGASMDLSAAKISFYIDTDYTLEKAPAFESLAGKSEAELQQILQQIAMDNQKLIEKLVALFSSSPMMMSAA